MGYINECIENSKACGMYNGPEPKVDSQLAGSVQSCNHFILKMQLFRRRDELQNTRGATKQRWLKRLTAKQIKAIELLIKQL